MRIILYEIYDALEHLGYTPSWNESERGMSFNFNMELAVCSIEEDSMVVTFMVPCIYKIEYKNFDDLIRKVNSRNHIGRLVNLDGSAVSAVSSFYVFDRKSVDSQVFFAIADLNRLMRDFFMLLREA